MALAFTEVLDLADNGVMDSSKATYIKSATMGAVGGALGPLGKLLASPLSKIGFYGLVSVTSDAAGQYISTGTVDPNEAFWVGLTGAFFTAAALFSTGAFNTPYGYNSDGAFNNSGDVVEGAGSKVTSNDIQFSDKLSNAQWQKQINSRGWSNDSIANTINEPYTTRVATNRATGNSATTFYNQNGSYIIRDNVTGKVIQVSDVANPNWAPDPSIIDPYLP